MSQVAAASRFTERNAPLLITVEQYHRMIETGVLQEGAPYELLNGQIVHKDRSGAGDDPMSIGPGHAASVRAVSRLDAELAECGCFIQTQQPVMLATLHEPEPDGTLVVGAPQDFDQRHPGPADILCVIEVSDSSLEHDRTVKLPIYADAGIPLYLIINLVDRVIEVYSEPLKGKGRFARSETVAEGRSVAIPVAKGKPLSVPVKTLLPAQA